MQTQFRAQKPFPKDDAGNDIENSMTKPTKYYLTKEMVCRTSNGKLIDILPIFLKLSCETTIFKEIYWRFSLFIIQAIHLTFSQEIRERWVGVGQAKMLQEQLNECYMREGVNHMQNCRLL